MKSYLLLCACFLSLLFSGCSREKKMTEYFHDNKDSIICLKELGNEISKEYPCEFITIEIKEMISVLRF